jgi:hypothetical protein
MSTSSLQESQKGFIETLRLYISNFVYLKLISLSA